MSIEIVLTNTKQVFYPGQTVTGKIQCYFKKLMNLRAIRIKFCGKAETEWYESKSEYNAASKKHQTKRIRYSAEEVYFDQEFTLLEGGENFMLPAGKHFYPFSYILPQQLPSSFEGTYGNVRYTIKGVIDRPWQFDCEAKIQLQISSPLDLNYVPGSRDPINTSVEKNICCCWCKSGPITFDISLPFRGYCPGQEIKIGAYVQNMSNVSAGNVKFKIYKMVEFISHIPSTRYKYEEHLVTQCVERGIGAHGEKSWTSVVPIPLTDIYPNLTPCSIINVYYEIKAKVLLPCPHTNLEAKFPCIIGSIPFIEGEVGTVNFGPPGSGLPVTHYHPGPSFEDPSSHLVSFSPGLQNVPASSGSAPYPPEQPYPPGPSFADPTAGLASFSHGLQNVPVISSTAPYPPGPPNMAPDGLPYPTSAISAPYSHEKTNDNAHPIGDFSASAPSDETAPPYPSGNGFLTSSDATVLPSYEEAFGQKK